VSLRKGGQKLHGHRSGVFQRVKVAIGGLERLQIKTFDVRKSKTKRHQGGGDELQRGIANYVEPKEVWAQTTVGNHPLSDEAVQKNGNHH